MSSSPMPGRMQDPVSDLSRYGRDVFVECPSCSACAHVTVADPTIDWDASTWSQRTFTSRRLTCGRCGHSATKTPSEVTWGTHRDPFFGHPLFLTTSFRQHVLWAYNLEHLAVLRQWIAATHRQRRPPPASGPRESRTMLESLPAWMTAAGDRAALLAAIDKLARGLT